MSNTVYIMCGASGAGKTTWIQRHILRVRRRTPGAALVCSADYYFYDAAGNYNFDPSKLGEAHAACLKKFVHGVMNPDKTTIYVDNTNTTLHEMAPYVRLAQAYGWDVFVVSFAAGAKDHPYHNVHGVPMHIVERMHRNAVDTHYSLFKLGISNENIIDAS